MDFGLLGRPESNLMSSSFFFTSHIDRSGDGERKKSFYRRKENRKRERRKKENF